MINVGTLVAGLYDATEMIISSSMLGVENQIPLWSASSIPLPVILEDAKATQGATSSMISSVTFEELLRNLPPNIASDKEISKSATSHATTADYLPNGKIPPCSRKRQLTGTWARFSSEPISLSIPFSGLSQNTSLPRAILLCPFSPKICITLARKQFLWPVVFVTDSGHWQPPDVRATNLQEAVGFAKEWELDDVVLASEPFVLAV